MGKLLENSEGENECKRSRDKRAFADASRSSKICHSRPLRHLCLLSFALFLLLSLTLWPGCNQKARLVFLMDSGVYIRPVDNERVLSKASTRTATISHILVVVLIVEGEHQHTIPLAT